MPREKAQVRVVGDQSSGFKFQEHADTLLAVQLIELGEMTTKWSKDTPRPYVLLRVAKIEEDNTATILTTGFKMFAEVLVDVFSKMNPDNWLTGSWTKPKQAWIWQDSKPEQDESCDQAVASLETMHRALKVVQDTFTGPEF